jgi:hypothetical protein
MCVGGAADSRRVALDLLQTAKHRFYTESGIRIRMFLGLPDPDPLVRGMDPDPSLFFFNSGSRVIKIPDPRSASESKNLSIFNPKKLFLQTDLGCSSWIPDPDPHFFPIPDLDPETSGQKSTGSRIRIRNTG